MTAKKLNGKIDDLFARGEWEEARRLLEKEREKAPDNHWVLTQLGVTLYEQQRYEEALPLFLASLKIVPDCPLTLWNLAGTLAALGKHAGAMRIYAWLLQSDRSPEDDPERRAGKRRLERRRFRSGGLTRYLRLCASTNEASQQAHEGVIIP